MCVFFRAFAATHVTWGRPVFPLICLHLQKEGIHWNTLFRHFILISDRSSQGYWSLTQAVIKTQFGAMGEVFCGFKQPLCFSNLFFFQAISSHYRKWRQMPFTTVFALKANLDPSLTGSLSILNKSYTWLQLCLLCCNEASSMAPLTSRPGRCGKLQLLSNTFSFSLFLLAPAHTYIQRH